MVSVRMLVAGWINQETTLKNTSKYRIVIEMETAELQAAGEELQILFETNNYQKARRECIELAQMLNAYVEVLSPRGSAKFTCDGYIEAETRYPKIANDGTFDRRSDLAYRR